MVSTATVSAQRPVPAWRFAQARLREVAVDSFWVVPSIFLVGAVVLAYVLGLLDRTVTASVWWVGTSDAAADVLGAIATAMLTFLGVVFSITLVALQLASQQFSPRVTRTFVRSTTTKVAFGVFTATFVTALLSLSRIEGGGRDLPGPVASVTVSLLLVGASLIRFVARIGQYLGPGMPLAEIYGGPGPTADQLRRAVQFGRERTLHQDPAYGIRELVDIGCQALSPAVNAPTTAVQVIDRLTELLARIGARPERTGRYADSGGVVRVVVPEARRPSRIPSPAG